MRITVSTMPRAAGLAIAAVAAISALPSVAGASVPVDIHVVTNDGAQLANLRQYAPSAATVKTYAGDDCFDPTPPIKQSSGQTYTQSAPNMLSAVEEAADATPSLQPFKVSDADFASFGSLSICNIGAGTPPGFWFLKDDHVGNSAGADQTFVKPGDQLVYYRSPSDFSADEELSLDAPARTTPGAPIVVHVGSYQGDGTLLPDAGATVSGGDAPATTDGAGNATVAFNSEGIHTLIATEDYNDVPSQALSVCVSRVLTGCTADRGLLIVGSHEADDISGTAGDDVIKPRAGADGIRALAGNDIVDVRGGDKDRVNCGGGVDLVKGDKRDKFSKNCERRIRNGKKEKHKHHKHKGKHGK
jgi:Ca2+-binding RTX toxin-like protein